MYMNTINSSGTFILFFANMLSKLFGAFYRLPLSNILGAEGIGLYQMAFPIYSFLLTLITGGVSITLTRKIATLRASNNDEMIYKQYLLGKRTSLFFGIIFFIVLLVFAYPLTILQGNVKGVNGYFAISIGFIFACLLGSFRGYYQGHSNMFPTAISQVLEQTSKLVFGLFFAYMFLSYGKEMGVFGALLGISVSEIISFMYFFIINKKRIIKHNVSLTKQDYKSFVKQVMPVSVSYVLLPLSSLLDSFLIVNLLTFSGFSSSFATSLYGIETGMILPLINMPNVLISALALSNLPEISYKMSKNIDITKQVSTIFKLVLIFILPCCVGLFVMSEPILKLVFPTLNENLMNIAMSLLKFSVFEMFFMSFVTITNVLLQAMNKTKKSAISLFIGILIKLIFTIIFVMNNSINIYGLVFASILGYLTTSLINLKEIKLKSNFRLKFIEIFSPIFASFVMLILIAFMSNMSLFVNDNLKLIFTILLAIVVYFAVLILFKQINLKEFKKALQTKSN